MKENFFRFLSVTFLVFAGCGEKSDIREYESSEALMRSPDSSWVVSDKAVPQDAFDIEIKSDADTGLVLVSYVIRGEEEVVKDLNMKALPATHYSYVLNNVGFSRPRPNRIFYKCNSKITRLDDAKIVAREVIFFGRKDDRGYYWNSFSTEMFNRLCTPY